MCVGCNRGSFQVELERVASGWESFDLDDFKAILGAAPYPLPRNPFWRSKSFLACSRVSGDEILKFCSMSEAPRRRMYIAWKRRELEATLPSWQGVCKRCQVIYKVYKNDWNRREFCSRSCGAAASRSKKVAK
jgi:hypothetical protein